MIHDRLVVFVVENTMARQRTDQRQDAEPYSFQLAHLYGGCALCSGPKTTRAQQLAVHSTAWVGICGTTPGRVRRIGPQVGCLALAPNRWALFRHRAT